ncbi:MAG TPA: AraC family transcriptional regulator [Burkholderiales bacterium]
MLKTPKPDVLTNVLRSLRFRIELIGSGKYGGDWAVDFGDSGKALFHLIGNGPLWLHCNLYDEPLELNEGDVVFFPQPQWHQFTATPARRAHTVVPGATDAARMQTLISCAVEFETRSFNPILRSLPPVLVGHCQDEFASAELASITRLMLSEYDGTAPGYEAMRERLAEALLIQLLRYYIRTGGQLTGLLAALGDPQLALALAAMHGDPGEEWDVDRLATEANMSRSTFARRFGECIGTSPMDYLHAWRMQLAEHMLHDPRLSVAGIAQAVGYKTEAAFRHAFKRARGIGPGEARRAARKAAEVGQLVEPHTFGRKPAPESA